MSERREPQNHSSSGSHPPQDQTQRTGGTSAGADPSAPVHRIHPDRPQVSTEQAGPTPVRRHHDPDAAYRRPDAEERPPRAAFVPDAETRHTRRLATVSDQRTEEIALAASEVEQQRTAASRSAEGYRPSMQHTQRQQRIIREHRLNAKDRKSVKRTERELARVKRFLRRRVSGKPRKPASVLGFWGGLGQGIFSLVKMFTVLLIIIVIFGGSLALGIVFGYVSSTDPVPANLLVSGDETSFIYDGEGSTISKLTGAYNIDREYISLARVANTYIADAFIAIEDERFESHIGIDPRRIASAVLSVIANRGEATHGGSTIVQQTVKLLTGDDQRSAQRKFQEWYRAIILNRQLTKGQIMELYINLVPMANQYVGVQSAAKAYFRKEASELNLAECAYLAGIPKSPSTYNPYTERGLRNGLRRQRIVLSKMHELGRITEDEYRQALNDELVFNLEPPKITGTDIQQYFTEYAIRESVELLENIGYTKEAARRLVYSGGLHIYTTLNPQIQAYLDEVYADDHNFQRNPEIYRNWPEQPQSSAVLIDNSDGSVIAMTGGVGRKTANLVTNRATDIRRQPGSAIKPLAPYAPAIDMGLITGATVLEDKQVFMDPSQPNTPWPLNYSRTYFGDIIMRYALKMSLNVPSVTTMDLLGVENAKYYMSLNGIDVSDDTSYLSLGVGAMTYGTRPIELTGGYATFFNQGVYRKPYTVRRIENSSGEIIVNNEPETRQVFKPETAFIMSRLLEEVTLGQTSSVPAYGVAGNHGRIANSAGQVIQTALKTGTTDNFVDQWAAGGTPYYTLGIWYGFDNEIKMTSIPENDAYTVVDVWYKIMRHLHADLPSADWIQPAGIETRSICAATGYLANEVDFAQGFAITEYFPAGSPLIPQDYCPLHRYQPPPTPQTEPEDSAEPVPEPAPSPEPAPAE